MKRIAKLVLPFLACSANAAQIKMGDFIIHGFLDAGVAWSNAPFLDTGVEPIYISNIRKQPSFDEDTNVGIQITKYIRDDVSITTQLYAQADQNFDVEATWAFLKWEPNDHWQFRVGRVRTEPYMLSDFVEVGYAYPWIRPPQEVYSQIPTDNFTGLDGRLKFLLWGRDLTLSIFWGSSSGELSFPIPPGNTILETVEDELRHIWSFNAKYGNEVFSVRAGFEMARVTLYPNAGSSANGLNDFLNTLVNDGIIGPDWVNFWTMQNIKATFGGVGYQFDWNDIVSMAEIVERHSPSPLMASAVGWYVMGGYRVKQFLPHLTFAREKVLGNKNRRFPAIVNEIWMAPPPFGAGAPVSLDAVAESIIGTNPWDLGGTGDQTSVTFGLRWDVYAGIAIKGEISHVHPDHGSPGLFFNNPMRPVNIYSLAVNAVM